jgi:transposase
MDARPVDPDAPLPTDVPTLHALLRQVLAEVRDLRRENTALRAENEALRGRLDVALRDRFGRRSERAPGTRRPPEPATDPDPGPAAGHGRGRLPDHLERRTTVHDLTAAEQACPGCGTPRTCIGEQAAEQLDYDPGAFFVRRTVRKTYACHRCPPAAAPVEHRFTTAGPAEVGPIARGLCGPGLLAYVIASKFADHVPLHRLAGMIGRSGVTVVRSTLGDWVAAAADLLRPLHALLHRRALQSRAIHTDDTPVPVRDPGRDRTRRGHLWVVIGDRANPYVTFHFTPGYARDGPNAFLGGYTGYVHADALQQYADVYAAGATHVCCFAHARRKFVAAADAGDRRADPAVALIRRLYAVERGLPPLGSAPDAEAVRQARRQAAAVPVLAELRAWLDRAAADALPKSPLGQAITYARTHWAALGRYTERGYLSIDNNLSERTLRQVAVGRKNWGVLGSADAGPTAAVLYSVVGTCKHLGVDPFAYLRDALPGAFALGAAPPPEHLADWLPDAWMARQAPPSMAAAG